MKIKDAFDVLGLEVDTPLEEVKKTYRNLAKQYHPDTQSGQASDKNFSKLHEAYILIQNYYTFKSSHYTPPPSQSRPRYSPCKEAKQRKEAKRQQIISNFFKSKTFLLSQIISAAALLLVVIMCVDYFYKPVQEYEPVQYVFAGLPYSYGIKNQESYIIIQDRKIGISLESAFSVRIDDYISIERTRFFQQIKTMHNSSREPHTPIEFYDSYNDTFFSLVLLLLASGIVVVMKSRAVWYLFLARIYTLYFVPLIMLYVCLGNYRILRLCGVLD